MLPGRYWLLPDGRFQLVCQADAAEQESHEEWSHRVLNREVEDLLADGWVRIQSFPGLYAMIDHTRERLSPEQRAAVAELLGEGSLPPFPKVSISRVPGEYKDYEGDRADLIDLATDTMSG